MICTRCQNNLSQLYETTTTLEDGLEYRICTHCYMAFNDTGKCAVPNIQNLSVSYSIHTPQNIGWTGAAQPWKYIIYYNDEWQRMMKLKAFL